MSESDIVRTFRSYALDKDNFPRMGSEVIPTQVKLLTEAADTITALRAEVERLRAALEEIASGKYSGIVLTSYPPQDPAVNRARTALKEKP